MKYYNAHEHMRYRVTQTAPSMRYDGKEDFKEWQKKAKEKLEELLGLPLKCARINL